MSQKEITVGQDAFLDIVANLVGILIILVVVVGAQAASSVFSAVPDAEIDQQINSAVIAADKQKDRLKKYIDDNESLERLADQENEVAGRLAEIRQQRLIVLETLKENIRQRELKLSARDQAALARRDQYDRLQDELQSIAQTKAALLVASDSPRSGSASDDSQTIEHYPNPIARTVLSEEVHFRLSDGKLCPVPLDELTDLMKQQWRRVAQDAQNSNQIRQTVGPIGNFRLQYELESRLVSKNSTRRRIRFKKFSLLPVDNQFGETIDQALNDPNSRWQQILKRHPPRKTTVSIWVYPDSYAEHQRVKRWIYEHEFQMVSWPLSEETLISGGPNGFKSSAQ